MGAPSTLPWLHELRMPALVVAGDDDPVMPLANALLLANRLPAGRLLVAPGEGHLLLLDPQSSALPAIRDFLFSEELEASAAWREAVEVTRPMVDAAVPAGLPNPVSLLKRRASARSGASSRARDARSARRARRARAARS